MFHDTIRANLLYAKPDGTDEQINLALRDAQVLGLVESLPEGLETLVGERGYRFSGGEKQRLAKTLLKRSDECNRIQISYVERLIGSIGKIVGNMSSSSTRRSLRRMLRLHFGY